MFPHFWISARFPFYARRPDSQIYYLNSCQSRFSDVHLASEVFQDIWHSNKEHPCASCNATLSCRLNGLK